MQFLLLHKKLLRHKIAVQYKHTIIMIEKHISNYRNFK